MRKYQSVDQNRRGSEAILEKSPTAIVAEAVANIIDGLCACSPNLTRFTIPGLTLCLESSSPLSDAEIALDSQAH
jgi:hypothetical protein